MSQTAFATRPWRPSTFLANALTLVSLTACHRGSTAPGLIAPRDTVPLGYGTESRAQAGGSVQSAAFGSSTDRNFGRVEEMLEGRFPGVHVIRTASGGYAVRIRGVGASASGSDPLYVIDGMPVEITPGRGLDFLSPADVARIAVLKDPAETSIYGVRGANGVVLITTKRRR